MRRIIPVASLLVVGSQIAAADTLLVPEQFVRIQDAIDAASNGDVVSVDFGVYHEAIDTRGKAITLTARDLEMRPILDGTGVANSLITIDDGESWGTLIDGFVVRNGTGAELTSGRTFGGGLRVAASSPLIRNVRFESNTASGGGGAYLASSWVMFDNCEFVGNLVETGIDGGGAGLQARASTAVLVNCLVADNHAPQSFGGGIAVDIGELQLVNTRVGRNHATWDPAVYSRGSELGVHNSVIAGNIGTASGGGIRLIGTNEMIVRNSIVWGNTSATDDPDAREIVFPSSASPSDLEVEHSIIGAVNVEAIEHIFGDNVLTTNPTFEVADDHDHPRYLALAPSSSGVNQGAAGDAGDLLTQDWSDSNGNGDYYEPLPHDALKNERVVGQVDMGAFELQTFSVGCPQHGDLNANGLVELDDLLDLVALFGQVGEEAEITDLDHDGDVDVNDLIALLLSWGPCPG